MVAGRISLPPEADWEKQGKTGLDAGAPREASDSILCKRGKPADKPVSPPPVVPDRKHYAEAMQMTDLITPQGRYINAILTARQAILWSDLYATLGIKGRVAHMGMHETWHYGLSLVNQWGKKRLKYYAYQTVNKLLYDPQKLKRPQQVNTLPNDLHSHIYLRGDDQLLVILWTPLWKAEVDVVINDKSFAYPVQVDLFDLWWCGDRCPTIR